MSSSGWICGPRIYEYDGTLFEYGYHGPWPLKKDLTLKKLAGYRFYNKIAKFDLLSDLEKKEFFVGGGCMPIGQVYL